MILRKLAYLNHEEKHHEDVEENFLAEILDWNQLRHTSLRKAKTGGKIILWATLRAYVLFVNFINKKTKEIYQKIQGKLHKHKEPSPENSAPKEPSKYLKMISEYRKKIAHIKHKIKQEEGIE